ncbi:MAG: hypothetical protein WKH64_16915 [Chloroflexia bacterium]
MYRESWQRAKTDAERVLTSRTGTVRERRGPDDTLELWRHEYFTRSFTTKQGTDDALQTALKHIQEAAKLVDQQPAAVDHEANLERQTASDLQFIATFLKSDHAEDKDPAVVARYDKLLAEANTRLTAANERRFELQRQGQERSRTVGCAGPASLQPVQEAVRLREDAKALELAQQYNGRYPRDPAGLRALGWTQYLNNDLPTAMDSTRKFEQAAPQEASGPANRAIVLLAQGKPSDARQAYTEAWEKTADEYVGLRLNALATQAQDLNDLAREREDAREEVRAALPAIAAHVLGLPAEARPTRKVKLTAVLMLLGETAVIVGDADDAVKLHEEAAELYPDFELARSNWLSPGC